MKNPSLRAEPLRRFSSARAGWALLALAGPACAPAQPPVTEVSMQARRPAGVSAPSGSRLSRVFGSAAAPALFDVAAKLQLGMAMDAAKSTAPELFGPAPHRPGGMSDLRMKAAPDAYGRLGAVVVLLPRKTALADVMGLWGEPVKGFDAGAKASLYWWFDRTARLRATLEDEGGDPETSRLSLERYFPVAELIGTARDSLGFEKEPLLGMADARVAEVYREYLAPAAAGAPAEGPCSSQILVLPPVEEDGTFTRVRLHCGGGTVRSFDVLMRFGRHFALKDEILRLLRRKLGEPAPKKDVMGREVLEYPVSAPKVRFREEAGVKDAILEVTRAPGSPP